MRCDWHFEIFGAGLGTDLGHILGWSKASASQYIGESSIPARCLIYNMHQRYLGTCETRPVEKIPPQIQCQKVSKSDSFNLKYSRRSRGRPHRDQRLCSSSVTSVPKACVLQHFCRYLVVWHVSWCQIQRLNNLNKMQIIAAFCIQSLLRLMTDWEAKTLAPRVFPCIKRSPPEKADLVLFSASSYPFG